MEKNKLIPVSIILLAISIAFGSIWIGNSLKEASNLGIDTNTQEHDVIDDILTLEEAARYLKIREGDLLALIRENGLGINYVKINNHYIFSKEGLDQWVQSTRAEIQR